MPKIFASMRSLPREWLSSANASQIIRVLSAEFPYIRTDPTRRKSPHKSRKAGAGAEETARAAPFYRVAENGPRAVSDPLKKRRNPCLKLNSAATGVKRSWISGRICARLSSRLQLRSQQIGLENVLKGIDTAFVFPKIVPLVPYVAVPRVSHLAPKLKSLQRRQQDETKY